jgi:hypothetical protein
VFLVDVLDIRIEHVVAGYADAMDAIGLRLLSRRSRSMTLSAVLRLFLLVHGFTVSLCEQSPALAAPVSVC